MPIPYPSLGPTAARRGARCTYSYIEDFAETVDGVDLRVDSIDHARGAVQLGAETEWSGQMDDTMTYLTFRGMAETGAFGSDTIDVDFSVEDDTIRTQIEAIEEQRWSLALTGGTRSQYGSEFSLSYSRESSDEDEHDNFVLKFLFPL